MIFLPNKDDCVFCKNLLPKKDGWRCCCKAFPDGIPHDILFNKVDILTLEECANGYHFEPDVEAQRECKYLD